jgi:mycobactin polyketide synthetase MbtD
VNTSSYQLPNRAIPVLLSADTHELLRSEAAALLSYVTDHSEVAPQAIAGMLFRTRIARRHRALAMVANRDELLNTLQAVIDGREHTSLVCTNTPAKTRRLAYVFPGQGVQRPGMGRLFYESIPAFRAEVDRCVQAFEAQLNKSPLSYLLDEQVPAEDAAGTIQPALFTQMVGLAAMWRSFGVTPNITIGHSQGEIAAAYISGTITLTDAVRVVGIRARAADEFASRDYAMAVVAADRDTCEDLLARCLGWAELSVVNSPRMVGISGDRDTVQSIVDTFSERGTFARVIRVQYPAHTSLINGLGEKVRVYIQRELQNPKFLVTDIDCLGATLGCAITQDLPVDEYWFWNLRNTVRFDKAITAAVARDIDSFVELAEHPTLQSAIQDNLAVAADERDTMVIGTSNRAANDLSEFTHNLASLAVHDLDYPWECLRIESDGPVSLPLPDFPNTRMNETRLWLPRDQSLRQPDDRTSTAEPAPAATPTTQERVADTAPPRLLAEEWVLLSHRSLVPPRAIGIIDHTRACAELATALRAAAGDLGATARVISVESRYAGGDLDTHVVLLRESRQPDDAAAAADVATFFSDRAWWPRFNNTVTDCWLVTVAGEVAVPNDMPPDLVHAAASAGFRSIAVEHPGVRFRHLDLPNGLTTSASVNAILSALHTGEESELAFRSGSFYAKRIVECDTSVADLDDTPLEHVLIIGGTGNLGLEFCDHFAHRGSRRITLVSRSGETVAVTDRLQQIRSATTTRVHVTKCDVTEEAAVSRLAERNQDTPADLIIHAAVNYSDVELKDITTEKAEQALATKVVGIWRVLGTFPRTDNCRVVLCSSAAATVGGRGQVIYAATNRMLDAMAHRLRAEGLDCVSVQWGQWTVHLDLGASGMANLVGTGVVPMLPADALALGMRRFHGNAVVAAFDLARAQPMLEAYGCGSLLSQLTSPATKTSATSEETDTLRRLTSLLAKTISVDNVDTIDTQVPMVAVGLDSLQALEFRRRVKTEFNHDLAISDLLGGASIADVLAQMDTQSQAPQQPAVSQPGVPAVGVRAPFDPSDMARRARQAAEETIPTDLCADRLLAAREDSDAFGMCAMMDTLEPALSDGAACTAEDIAARLEFAPRHQWLLRRWLGVLTAHGHLDHDSRGSYRLLRPVPVPTRSDLSTVWSDLGYPPALGIFMHNANEHLTEIAQDRLRIQELLFADGGIATADAFYRDNIVSRYLNRAAREVIAGFVARLQKDRSPVRILELGAGTGGTTADIITGLSGMPVDYHFTDLSSFFLAAAQRRFAEYPQIRYGTMDLNADLGERSRYDIVLAANVIHNALHVGQTLRRLQELISPGGVMVFIEVCKANYQLLTSLKFLMSANPGQPHPGQSDIRAGARIFLTEKDWLDQLTVSGFTPLPVLPEPNHPLRVLDQRLFVAMHE